MKRLDLGSECHTEAEITLVAGRAGATDFTHGFQIPQ